jgi:hypothetical protein
MERASTPRYPEGDYVAVFCEICGGKNRQDEGWRFRDDRSDPVLGPRYAQEKAQMAIISAMVGRPFQVLTYQCDSCRDDQDDEIAERTGSEAETDEGGEEHDDGEVVAVDISSAKR